MAEESINELIAPEAIKQIEDCENKLASLSSQMDKTLAVAKQLMKETGNIKSFTDLADASEKQRKVTEELTASQKEHIKIQKQLNQTIDKIKQSYSDEALVLERARQELKERNKEIREVIKSEKASKESVKEVEFEIRGLNETVKSNTEVLKENSEVAKTSADLEKELMQQRADGVLTLDEYREKLIEVRAANDGTIKDYEALSDSAKKQVKSIEILNEAQSKRIAKEKEVIKEGNETNQLYEEAKQKIEVYHESIEENIRQQGKLQAIQAKIKEQLKTLNEENKAGAISNERYNESFVKLREEQERNAVAISSLGQTIKAQAKELEATEGSMNGFSQQLSLLSKAYRELSDEARNSEFGEELLATIQKLDPTIKGFDATLGNFQRNVGNYAEYGGRYVISTKSLSAEMYDLTRAIADMNSKGEMSDPVYAKMVERATELRQAMNETSAALRRFGDNMYVVSGIAQFGSSVAGVTGMLKGFAKEGGDAEKVMLSIQKTMQMLIALQQISSALMKRSALMTTVARLQLVALNKAEAIRLATTTSQTKATIGATIAQKAFNVVAKANPYVLLATALVTVVGALALFSKGTKEATEDQKKLNEAVKSQNDNMASELISYKKLQAQWASMKGDRAKQEKFIKDYSSELNSLGGSIDTVNKAEQFFADNTKAVQESIKLRTQATMYSELALNEQKKAFETGEKIKEESSKTSEQIYKENAGFWRKLGNTILMSTADGYDMVARNKKEFAKKYLDGLEDLQKDELEKADGFIDEYVRLMNEASVAFSPYSKNNTKDLENYLKKQEEIQKKYADLSVQAIEDETQRKVAVRDLQYDRDLKALQANFKDISNLTEQEKQAQLDLETVYWRERDKIQSDNNDKIKAEREKTEKAISDNLRKELENRIALVLKEQKERAAANDLASSEEEKAVLEQYRNGEIKREEYDKKIYAIRYKWSKASVEAEIEALEELLPTLELNSEKHLEISKKLHDAKTALNDAETDNVLKNLAEQEKARKKAFETAKQLALDSFNLMADWSKQLSDQRIDEHNGELKRAQERSDREMESLEASVMSEETRKSEEIRIKNELKQEEDRINAQIQAEKEKQARWEKAQALVQVAINTGQAITASAKMGFPLAVPFVAAATALGVAQAAMIASKQIPQYAKGTDDHEGGLAVVGDGGKKEYAVTPSGEVYETPSIPTLIDLPKHSQVFPDLNAFIQSVISDFGFARQNEPNNEAVVNEIRQLGRVIKENKSIVSMNLSEEGIWVVGEKGKGKKRIMNRKVSTSV